MQSIATGLSRRIDQAIDAEIALGRFRRSDSVGFIGHPNVECAAIGITEDCDGANPELPQTARDSNSNLATVGDQNFFEHAARPRYHAAPRGLTPACGVLRYRQAFWPIFAQQSPGELWFGCIRGAFACARCYTRAALDRDSEDIIRVAELHRRLKRTLEGMTAGVWIEGEVTSLKRAPSGHVYFCLKDETEDAVVDCVLYRFNALRARRFLADGARIQLSGRPTVWAPRGRLQWVGDSVRPVGRGALLEALEKLKQRLAAEGLFDPARRRPLPSQPKVVGVVTSAAGAAIHDICVVAHRRAKVKIVLSPALVQGDAAPDSLIRALDRLERYPGLDVVIIGRGGGSGEDLLAFNDERVVRRVAALTVPVVSAVGHEVDVTLTDLVADVRAATPSQAAELVVPDAEARREALGRASLQLARALHGRIVAERLTVDRLRSCMSDPRFVIAERQQHLDELEARLWRSVERRNAGCRARLEAQYRQLLSRHPRAVIARARVQSEPLNERLRAAMIARTREARAQLRDASGRLDSLSPLSVLGRGYAIALGSGGRAVRDANELEVGEPLLLRLSRGEAQVRVESKTLPTEAPHSQDSTTEGSPVSTSTLRLKVPPKGQQSSRPLARKGRRTS